MLYKGFLLIVKIFQWCFFPPSFFLSKDSGVVPSLFVCCCCFKSNMEKVPNERALWSAMTHSKRHLIAVTVQHPLTESRGEKWEIDLTSGVLDSWSFIPLIQLKDFPLLNAHLWNISSQGREVNFLVMNIIYTLGVAVWKHWACIS